MILHKLKANLCPTTPHIDKFYLYITVTDLHLFELSHCPLFVSACSTVPSAPQLPILPYVTPLI